MKPAYEYSRKNGQIPYGMRCIPLGKGEFEPKKETWRWDRPNKDNFDGALSVVTPNKPIGKNTDQKQYECVVLINGMSPKDYPLNGAQNRMGDNKLC